MLETIGRLPVDQLGRNVGGSMPSCSRHVRHVAVAMAKQASAVAVAWQRRIEHSAVMGVWRPNT